MLSIGWIGGLIRTHVDREYLMVVIVVRGCREGPGLRANRTFPQDPSPVSVSFLKYISQHDVFTSFFPVTPSLPQFVSSNCARILVKTASATMHAV
jgi:hypothetical protein